MNIHTAFVSGNIGSLDLRTTDKDGNQLDKPFLKVTVYSNHTDANDVTTAIKYSFNNNNGLLTLFKQNKIKVGMGMTLEGCITAVRNAYVNKDGVLTELKTPEVLLNRVNAQPHWQQQDKSAEAPEPEFDTPEPATKAKAAAKA